MPWSLWAVISASIWMCIMWCGPSLMGYLIGQTGTTGLEVAEAWLPWMALGTMSWGLGQGSYLAGDQSLWFALLPDPEQASRYLGFNNVCCFVGTTTGGAFAGTLLAVFGTGADRGY